MFTAFLDKLEASGENKTDEGKHIISLISFEYKQLLQKMFEENQKNTRIENLFKNYKQIEINTNILSIHDTIKIGCADYNTLVQFVYLFVVNHK